MNSSLLDPYDDQQLPAGPQLRLPRVGDVIEDKYTVTKLIGEGGMGVVYEAFHMRLGRSVALKFLHPDAIATPGGLERFEREAHAASELRGPHVCRVLDVDSTPGLAPFMVMELLHGRDLEAELRERGALPVDEAVDIVLQACAAMYEAHSRGIVHRDLKPSNIFLVRSDVDHTAFVKVLDFGVSLFAERENMARVTATTMSVGTPLYMSPEQVRCSKRVDARTDVWSLGVVLFEALVGEPPFDGASTAAVAAIVADETPSVRTSRADVPVGLDVVIARALAKDVTQRFQSVEEFARALAPFGSGRVRSRAHASLDELARTWMAWPPVRKSLARASAAASAVRIRRPDLMRRLPLIAALGTCLVALPAITFAGFGRETPRERTALPVRCEGPAAKVEAPPPPPALAEVGVAPMTSRREARAHAGDAGPREGVDAVRNVAAPGSRPTPVTTKPLRSGVTDANEDPLYL